jgi:hypothetical protein
MNKLFAKHLRNETIHKKSIYQETRVVRVHSFNHYLTRRCKGSGSGKGTL